MATLGPSRSITIRLHRISASEITFGKNECYGHEARRVLGDSCRPAPCALSWRQTPRARMGGSWLRLRPASSRQPRARAPGRRRYLPPLPAGASSPQRLPQRSRTRPEPPAEAKTGVGERRALGLFNPRLAARTVCLRLVVTGAARSAGNLAAASHRGIRTGFRTRYGRPATSLRARST